MIARLGYELCWLGCIGTILAACGGSTSDSAVDRLGEGHAGGESSDARDSVSGDDTSESGEDSGAGSNGESGGSAVAESPGSDAVDGASSSSSSDDGTDVGGSLSPNDDGSLAGTGSSTSADGWSTCRCGEAGCGACVVAPVIEFGTFAIDAHEVTNAQYAAFLASSPDADAQGEACANNGSFVPINDWPPENGEDFPVVWVDWCDAYAYCRWAGKRLCGAMGGGPIPDGGLGDVRHDEWYHACTEGGIRDYPYGDEFIADSCNGEQYWEDPDDQQALPVGSLDTCQVGELPLYDLVGNVWEWVDHCPRLEPNPEDDMCTRHGGSFWSETANKCAGKNQSMSRQGTNKNVGFRCCGEL